MSANSSTTNQWLKSATETLESAGLESARLDSLILLEDALGKDRTHLLAHPEIELSNEQITALNDKLVRRVTHEPLAYIRGKCEFYGREFNVNHTVLVPRPESESIIELLKEYGDIPTIIDVGTGSGALAITAQLNKPTSTVIAVDIDENCLKIAQQNAVALGAKNISFKHGDLLRGLQLDTAPAPIAILANLPYVPDAYPINKAATHEPDLALFGGTDGLDPYRILFDQLAEYDDTPLIVISESLESQHHNLAGIAKNHGFIPSKTLGLAQVFTYLPQ